MAPLPCSLCGQAAGTAHQDARTGRRYGRCPVCDLWSLASADRPSPAEARAQYALHQNDVEDPRYRAFVAPLYEAIAQRLPPTARGLDYGAGPGPALARMLTERGHQVDCYDPIYYPDASFGGQPYDFIVASEVAEHFFSPLAEFTRLHALLRPGGTLAVMTLLTTPALDFAAWHYRNDPTHVAFYSDATFAWIQRALGFAKLSSDGRRVVVLEK